MSDTDQILEENGLVYLTDSEPGISRQLKRNKFVFTDPKGRPVNDPKTLERIQKLVIPPAWTQVWIAPKKNAHLQATGIDQAGRKQYRYHDDWCKSRNETKYFRLLEFGSKLPEFRRNIAKDLRRKTLDERKVLAISVHMMQKTLIRIGNESYRQLYGSYGLTTLKDKHVKISGSSLLLCFRGKKGVFQEIKLTDRNLARLVKKCRDIPGQELFQFYRPGGERKAIDSGLINNYIREISCCDFTAKDFRTWSGTLEMLRELARRDYPDTENGKKRVFNEALDAVSKKLGNSRAVCKKSYVFPSLADAYENGELLPFLKKTAKTSVSPGDKGLHPDEKILLSFLKRERRKKKA